MAAVRPKTPIEREILRLSLRIALLRYELKEDIVNGVPLGLCTKQVEELAIMQMQKTALQNGDFASLPYNIKQLGK